MKSPLIQSFTPTHFSLRSVGVDRFRFLLKGWGLKVLSLLVVVMVGGVSWGQITEGFESGLRTSGYAGNGSNTGNLTLSSGDWVFINSGLRNSVFFKSGLYSCQMQSGNSNRATLPSLNTCGTISFWFKGGTPTLTKTVSGVTTNVTLTTGSTVSSFVNYTATINESNSAITLNIYNSALTSYLDDVATTTYSSAPLSPTMGTITPSNQQLSVAFTAGSNGGSAITNYKYSTNGGTSFSACSPAQTTSPIVITGLTNGTSYNVQIKAVNAIGDGTATSSTAATPVTNPSAPSITSITPGNQELSVAFTAGATGGSAITNYKYSTNGGTSFTACSPEQTSSPITITGLTNDTQYDVQIKAVNAQGDGAASASSQGTPTASAVAPGAPAISSITPSNQQLSVAFTAGATGGSAITTYKYSTNGGANWQTRAAGTTASPLVISTLSTDGTTALTNGTSYNIQIKAVNAIGDGAATASTVATPATTPSAPSITLITTSNGQLSVAFTSGATGGSAITNYKYSTDGGSTFTSVSPAANTSPVTITGLSNGTSYNVQIKAVNLFGDGIATASTAATPITTPGAPTIGTATTGNGQATVTFTAPASNGGSVITSYSVTSSPAGGAGSLNQAGSGTLTVTGLTNGTAYTFTIKANNAAGASTASAASNSVTPILPAPVANAATNVLTNGFTANWDAVTGATGYEIDVYTNLPFQEDFTDGNITGSPSWSNTTNYAHETASPLTSGAADTDGKYIGSSTTAGLTASFISSSEVSEWHFSLGSTTADFSSVNYFGVILMSSASVASISASFNGYYLKCGVSGVTDMVELWKSTGTTKTKLGDFSITLGSTGAGAGVNLKITRNSSGVFQAYYSTGFTYAATPATDGGTFTDNTYSSSSYFGLFTNFTNVSNSRRVYLDNLVLATPVTNYVLQNSITSGTSQAVTGLSENTTYYYRVRTTDANTTTANSNVITVTTKQTPTVTPTIGTYTYTGSPQGPSAATNSGTGTSYTFSYSGSGTTTYGPSSTQPSAAGNYTVTESVAANGNYVAASSSATAFNITKATPTITTAPTASGIVLGQALSVSILSGGAASPTGGTFAFTSPSTVPSATGSYSASVTYTPSDVDNYNTATTNVNVSVVESLSTFSNTQFIGARNITRGTNELPIYRFQVDVIETAATLNSLTFTTPVDGVNSNYVNSDITAFKVFLTTSTTFSNTIQLGLTANSFKTQGNLGETGISFTSLNTTLNVGTTYYVWLTANVLSTATSGRTIVVNAPAVGITGSVSGANSATGTQTIIGVATNYYLNIGGSLTTSSNYFTSPNGAGTTLSAAGLSYTSNDVNLNIPISVINSGDFTLGNGSKIVVQNGGSLTVGASNTITGTIDVNDGGTLIINSTSILHTLGTLGTTSSTVIYNANGDQAVAAKPYTNLTIDGSGVKTVGTASVTGTLSLTSGTLDIVANTLTIAGSVSRTNGNIDADAGTLSFANTNNLSLPTSLFSGNIYNLAKASGAGTVTLNDNLTVTNELTSAASTGAIIIPSSKVLTVSGTGKATINGTLTNDGTFTLNSGATLLQGSGSAITGGAYNVKQTVTGSGGSTPNGRFWYLGGALSDASSTALLSSTGNQLWQWNEDSFGYTTVTSGQTLTQGKSYVLRSGQTSETINFSGTGLSNGTVTVSGLTRSGTTQTYRGCHLISNPYPSYLDWNAICSNPGTTNIGTTMYVRTAVGTTLDVMETFNSVNSLATTISSVPLTQYIAPMQGFWVKVTTDGQEGSLSMTNAMRSHQNGSGLRSTPQDFPAFLRFNMLDGQNKDQLILLMSPNAATTLDAFDSEKMSASGYAQFYSTVNATKLVINGMKNVKAKTSVPLTLVMPTSKSYTFQAEEFNIEDGLILLEDKQEGVIQDLTINPTYSFFGNAGTNATRFVVHFQLANAPILVGGPQELESLGSEDLTTDNIQIVSNNQGTIIIRMDEGFKPEGSIRIFDASGRLVEQSDFNDQEKTIHLNEQAGMYFVEVAAGKLMVKKKIVIN